MRRVISLIFDVLVGQHLVGSFLRGEGNVHCMVTYSCSIDESETVFGERECIECGADLDETPQWTHGSPPAGVKAVVSCDECGKRFGANKRFLETAGVDFESFESL